MTDDELRALVRDAIAKHLQAPPLLPRVEVASARAHLSHAQFLFAGTDADGPCVIEPAVSCNHCGFCKSYGH